MTTVKQDIIACFGEPTEYEFDITRYFGKNLGCINVIGLRHMGLVAAGHILRKKVEEHSGREYRTWDFMPAMQEWCAEYTNTHHVPNTYYIGKRIALVKGILENMTGNSIYFCIPPELNINIEALEEVG